MGNVEEELGNRMAWVAHDTPCEPDDAVGHPIGRGRWLGYHLRKLGCHGENDE